MNKNLEIVYEWCPFCGEESEYEVDEKTWVMNCKHCGRPIVLCDKCYPHDKCGNCPHERLGIRMMKKWMKEQFGKVVYWNDPDNGICSDYCRVIGFTKTDAYVLEPLYRRGSIVECFDDELEFLSEEKQKEILTETIDK